MHRTYVFAGRADLHTVLGDLWTLGTSWSRVTFTNGPSARYAFGMAEDRTSGKLIIYGGLTANGERLHDTWLFDPLQSTWTQVPTPHVPTQGASVAMDWSPSLSTVVVSGGSKDSGLDTNETWAFDRTTSDWVPLSQTGAPAANEGGTLSPDTCGGRDVLFGQYVPGATFSDRPWFVR